MNIPVTNLIKGAQRVRTSEMLSAEEEQALICAWQKHGDRRARDRLIKAFAPLTASIVKRFKRGGGELDPDLLQQAQIGLMKSVDRFDPDRGFRFATYAVWWVRAEIQDYLRANMSVVRRPNSVKSRAAAKHIAAIDGKMSCNVRLDRAEANKKLAATLGVDEKRAADLREQVAASDSSLNVRVGGEDGVDLLALLVDPNSLEDPVALQNLKLAELRRILLELLSSLPDRERDIIIATQVADPPATLEGLGTRLGISKERVRQLRERGFERLRAALQQRNLKLESFF